MTGFFFFLTILVDYGKEKSIVIFKRIEIFGSPTSRPYILLRKSSILLDVRTAGFTGFFGTSYSPEAM